MSRKVHGCHYFPWVLGCTARLMFRVEMQKWTWEALHAPSFQLHYECMLSSALYPSHTHTFYQSNLNSEELCWHDSVNCCQSSQIQMLECCVFPLFIYHIYNICWNVCSIAPIWCSRHLYTTDIKGRQLPFSKQALRKSHFLSLPRHALCHRREELSISWLVVQSIESAFSYLIFHQNRPRFHFNRGLANNNTKIVHKVKCLSLILTFMISNTYTQRAPWSKELMRIWVAQSTNLSISRSFTLDRAQNREGIYGLNCCFIK